MFTPLLVDVRSIGEDVVIAIGSWNRRLHFETAILLATWLDECGREAKAWSGKSERMLRAVGTLHDAGNSRWLDVGQPNDPLSMPRVNRDLLKREQIAVRAVGGTVELTAGSALATLPYEAALQISQWIRVRAKESQARAGDTKRHWSKVIREFVWRRGAAVTRG